MPGQHHYCEFCKHFTDAQPVLLAPADLNFCTSSVLSPAAFTSQNKIRRCDHDWRRGQSGSEPQDVPRAGLKSAVSPRCAHQDTLLELGRRSTSGTELSARPPCMCAALRHYLYCEQTSAPDVNLTLDADERSPPSSFFIRVMDKAVLASERVQRQ
ncbi:hypothetical protein V8E53_004473 [Lactarius tabidus]